MAVSDDYKALDKRIKALEDRSGDSKMGKEKVEKKTRPPSEYNIFMKKYINEEKEKGSKKSHAEIFSAGAKAWTLQKK